MKASILATAAAVSIMGFGLFGVSNTFAQNTNTQDPSNLVQMIADKFGLNKDEVQKVFDENHAQRYAEMEQQYTSRLDELVANGTITEAQKKLILEKHAELKSAREDDKTSWQNMTPEQHRAQMETKRQELTKWAQDNGIDMQYLAPFRMGKKVFGLRNH